MEHEGLIVSAPQNFNLTMNREPKAIIAEAKRAAQALTDLIKSKPESEKVMMNGKQYLEFEDWQTCGRFYSAAAKVMATEYIEIGSARGFLAKAVVIDTNTGIEISAAEAMCLNDEEKWTNRTKYEWHYVKKSGGLSAEDPGKEEIIWEKDTKTGKSRPKKERVAAGEVAVPLFQLRSMAQTRACAKALRNVFSWVVVLAGYAPTPAEDMTGDETSDKKTPAERIKPPEAKATPTAGASKEPPKSEMEGGKAIFIPAAKSVKKHGDNTRYAIKDAEDVWYSTFDKELGEKAILAGESKMKIAVAFKIDGEHKNIVSIEVAQ